jgi:hypothetical protein
MPETALTARKRWGILMSGSDQTRPYSKGIQSVTDREVVGASPISGSTCRCSSVR